MNYQLTQTGEQVQDILNQAPTTEETLQAEITRSTNKDDALELAIGNEKTRAEGVESNLQTAIGNEITRAEGAEVNLQTAIGNEKTRAELVEGALRTDVDGINAKIPTSASSENKLATESFVNSSISTNTADFKGTYTSLEQLQTEVHDANANDYAFVISTDAAGNTAYNRYKYVEGTGWVFEYALNNSSFTSAQWAAINSAITAVLVAKLTGLPTATELTTQLNAIIDSVATEKSRAEGIESGLRTDVNANATAIGTEKTRAEGVEGTLSTAIGNEKTRAEGAELVLQQNINAEALLRGNADTTLQTAIDGINAKIPAAASSSNQLADKTFVNSSIATNTATFRGTYNSVAALDEVTADNNDYAFVVATDTAGNTIYNRYKYVEGSGWVFEYALNNSSFTATQWAAVNSGITAALVTKLDGLPDNTALTAMFAAITNLIPSAATSENKLVDYAQMVAALATKQNTLTFDNVPTENSNNPVKSGGVYSAIATVTAAIVGLQSSKQDVLTFDQYPTAGSDNPVKSKGIYEKLAEKQSTLVPGTNLDTTPTANSNNPVTSGGVKAALDLKANQSALDLKANQSTLAEEVSRAQGAESALSSRISTNATDIANLQQLYNDLQQSKPVPVTALPSTGQQQGVIYRLAGTTSYSDYMWNGSSWVLMATYNNAIDPRPKKASQNLVTSGGVFDNMGALDVSELNATENPHTLAIYADLQAAIAAIPTDYQKGGMSIKFIQGTAQSSDNKYVQYMLMSDTFNTTVANWQGVDEEPTAGSRNLVESGGVVRMSVINLVGLYSTRPELNVGEYYFNTTTNNVGYLKAEDTIVVYQPTKNGLYRVGGDYYQWDETTLVKVQGVERVKKMLTIVLLSTLQMEQGGITPSGKDTDSETSVRVSINTYVNGVFELILPEGFIFRRLVYYNKSDKSILGNEVLNSRTVTIGKYNNVECYTRFSIQREDGSNITVAELIQSDFYGRFETEITSNHQEYLNWLTANGIALDMTSGLMATGQNVGDTATFETTTSNSWKYIKKAVKAGEAYYITNARSTVSQIYYAVTLTDANGVIKQLIKTTNYYSGFIFVQYDGFLVVNGIASVNVGVNTLNFSYMLDIEEDVIDEKFEPIVRFDVDYDYGDFADDIAGMDFSTQYMEDIYQKIDALIANNSDYITKYDAAVLADIPYPEYANGIESEVTRLASEVYGDDFPVGMEDYNITYDVTPAYKTYIYKLSYTNPHIHGNATPKRKIFITSCNHGWETAGSFNIYLLMKNLCTKFAENDFFMKLRTTFDIWVIPCLNGYGIYHGTRQNGNGVNINRNAPTANWIINESYKEKDYTGPFGASEFETKLFLYFLENIKPDMFIDAHNYNWTADTMFYTNSISDILQNPAYSAVVDINYCLLKNLPAYFGTEFKMFANTVCLPAYKTGPEGAFARYGAENCTPFSMTIEVDNSIPYSNGVYNGMWSTPTNTNDTYKVAEYSLRNQLTHYLNALLEYKHRSNIN